jgi:hypothetical protein
MKFKLDTDRKTSRLIGNEIQRERDTQTHREPNKKRRAINKVLRFPLQSSDGLG